MPRTSRTTISREIDDAELGSLSLLVIGDGTFVTHPLPPAGKVTIGRARGCEIRIDHRSISRTHATLAIGPPLTIEDLGSANGTRVRQTWLHPGEPAPVAPGEVLDLGTVMVIVQQRHPPLRPRRVWTHGYFEARLEEECARSLRSGKQLAVLRVGGGSSPAELEEALGELLRAEDVLGTYVPGEYEALLVDAAPEEAARVAERLRKRLERSRGGRGGAGARIGVACFPEDGRDAASLISAAAEAAAGASRDERQARPLLSPAMTDLHRLIERVAASTISVLILGETGVGKEVFSETVHRLSPRTERPFLKLNCAALSETLLESELFGHERGAFTGAVAAKPGLLETADGGTVFLDEVGDLPMTTQVKLLRVLEERKVLRVGAVKPRAIDVRFVAATNRDLQADIRAGSFRQDLYFRLNGISVVVPPLRERVAEIAPLARGFVAEACRKNGREPSPAIAAEALELLERYSWPGNIRELRNAIERAVILCTGPAILPEHLPLEKMDATRRPAPPHAPRPRDHEERDEEVVAAPAQEEDESRQVTPKARRVVAGGEPAGGVGGGSISRLRAELFDAERRRIVDALERCAGNQKEAAKLLGVSRRTLLNWLDQYGIPGPRKKRSRTGAGAGTAGGGQA